MTASTLVVAVTAPKESSKASIAAMAARPSISISTSSRSRRQVPHDGHGQHIDAVSPPDPAVDV